MRDLLVTALVLSVSASASAQNQDVQPLVRHDRVRPRLGVAGEGGVVLASAEVPNAYIFAGESFGIDLVLNATGTSCRTCP